MKTLRLSNTKPIRHNELGMSLIEVLAAIIILTVGILALAPMVVTAISANDFSGEATTVASAAQERLEELIGRRSFATMPYTECDSVRNQKFEVLSIVSDNSVDPSIPWNVYEITVVINWMDHSGVDRSMTFSTYSTKY